MAGTFDLASALANYDQQESAVRRYLEEKIKQLVESRGKGLEASQQSASGRGMLQSSQALRDYADVNLGYDREVAATQDDVNSQLTNIAKGRVDANNQYQLYLQEQAKQNAQNTQVFDPADPFNWKGIDAAIKNGTAKVENPDPLNWAAIDAAIKSGAVKDPRMTVKPAQSTRPVGTQTKPMTTKPAASTRPKQGYY